MDEEKYIQRLIKGLGSDDYDVRHDAIEKLVKIGEPAVPALIDTMKNEYPHIRHNAALVLGIIGDERAVLPLINSVKDEYSFVREIAVEILGRMEDERAVLPLSETLKDKYKDIRKEAAEALGNFAKKGIDCSAAVPALIDALKDEHWNTRCKVAVALGEIGDERAVPVLIDSLKDSNTHVCSDAGDALGKIGVNEEQVEMIIQMLKEGKTWQEIGGPINALGEIGDVRAILPLIDILKNGDRHVRSRAADALGKIGDKRGVPVLIEAMKDENSNVRRPTAWALGEIGDVRAVPALIDALKDEDGDVREGAAFSIDKILEKSIEEENYATALKTIKLFTNNIIKKYEGKKDRDSLKGRRERLAKLSSLAQEIHDKMNPDKKKFPVKHQPVRTIRRQVIRNG